jgi:hypothetical protein
MSQAIPIALNHFQQQEAPKYSFSPKIKEAVFLKIHSWIHPHRRLIQLIPDNPPGIFACKEIFTLIILLIRKNN